MKKFALICIVAILSACGGKTSESTDSATEMPRDQPKPASTSKAPKGHLHIRVSSFETDEQANGLIRNCTVNFDIQNKSGQRIKRLTMAFRPEVSDEFDAQVHAAAGKQSLYFRDIPKGKSTDSSTIRGLGCDGLTALNILDNVCSTDKGPCKPATVKLDGGDFFAIKMP